MTRISAAADDVPTTIIGRGRCLIMSITLATLQGATANSGENSPPTAKPKKRARTNISTSAMRKFGTAKPMKPATVKT